LSTPLNVATPSERRRPRLDQQSEETNAADLPADAELARVVAAWPELPELIRRAVLALIDSQAHAGPLS